MLKNANVTTLRQVLRRFSFALDGLKAAYRSEQSFRIQLAVSVVVVLAGGLLGLTQLEWLFVMKGVVGSRLVITHCRDTLTDSHLRSPEKTGQWIGINASREESFVKRKAKRVGLIVACEMPLDQQACQRGVRGVR